MTEKKTHWRDLLIWAQMGVSYPACQARVLDVSKVADVGKVAWPTSDDLRQVNCYRCHAVQESRYPWAGRG